MGHLLLLLLALLLTSTHGACHASAAITEERSTVARMVRAMLGSRPPTCEGRCRACGHCEAVQVPVTPHELEKRGGVGAIATAAMSASYDDHSNYKPLSWRCKCGGLLLNP